MIFQNSNNIFTQTIAMNNIFQIFQLVVFALFAAAAAEPEAEADPWYYYSGYAGYHHPYTYGYGYPYYQYVVPTVKAADEKVEEEVVEAKEVKKPVVYTHPYYYGGYAGLHYPYAYNYAPVAHTVVKPYTYYANSGGAVHIVKKREAEAEPEAEADPNAWYGYGYGYRPYWGYGYRSGYYHPYSYGYWGGYRGYYYG